MRTFRCPGCGDETKALALDCWHRCPAKRNKPTWYDDVTPPEDTKAQS